MWIEPERRVERFGCINGLKKWAVGKCICWLMGMERFIDWKSIVMSNDGG